MKTPTSAFGDAADAILKADSLVIAAGAGMGVDSGWPDFRGPGGFWSVYPALGKAGIPFESIANPEAFRSNHKLAWGFYGHRLKLYRETSPGPAFKILSDIASPMPGGAFAFTSNVDGHFQRAGFAANRVWECHGSIHHLQCLDRCMSNTWKADDFTPEVDADRCLLLNEPPHCPYCGGVARPNILMFGDWDWIEHRSNSQEAAFRDWLRTHTKKRVVIEIGAGTAIPTVRRFSEQQEAFLIRVNPTAPDLGSAKNGCSLKMNGTDAMKGIAMAMLERGWLPAPTILD